MRNASKDMASVRLIPTLTLTSRPSGTPESKQSLYSWAIAVTSMGGQADPLGKPVPELLPGASNVVTVS